MDVDDRFVVPDLDRIVDGATVRHDTVDLISTYYDTPQRDLQACGILVRRRHGDDDTGWQVKLPDGGTAASCSGRYRTVRYPNDRPADRRHLSAAAA